MPELLLEVLSEEIPARLQHPAVEDFKGLFCAKLRDQGLFFDSAEAQVTPRRLVLVIKGLQTRQSDRIEERKGPKASAPEKSILGFLQSAGCESLSHPDIEKREIKGSEFYFVKRLVKGCSTKELLPGIIHDAVTKLRWPRSMRRASGTLKWVRPIHSILCIFDGRLVKGNISTGIGLAGSSETAIKFTNKTRGHRFLAHEFLAVKNFNDYTEKLRNSFVIVEAEERRKIIVQKANDLAEEHELLLHTDDFLMNENTGLVEWPVVLLGSFSETFLTLPDEVLVTSMKRHQKYIPLYQRDGLLAPRFVVVSNLTSDDGGAAIVAGNERVLRARLYDAKFFWDVDRQTLLDDFSKRLGEITFHAKLGSMSDKVMRLAKLGVKIAQRVPKANADMVERAALLCKADLVTEMVGEFPELQGVMGKYYALQQGENASVAAAIAGHYSPLGPSDVCPKAPNSVSLALSDKIDVLVGMFGVGGRPSGSKDPYALRRAALGVIRLILENDIRLPLIEVIMESHKSYKLGVLGDRSECVRTLVDFITDRLKVHLRELDYGHDVVSAVFAVTEEDDLWRLVARANALKEFLASTAGADLLGAYNRASNIVQIEEKKDKVTYNADVNAEMLVQQEEKVLFAGLISLRDKLGKALEGEDYASAMEAIADLKEPVDAFFDQVTVNCENAALRQNRLYLLGEIRDSFKTVADFSLIKG